MCNLKRGNYKTVNTENTDFLFLGSKIRKQLLLGRKVMTNLYSMLKSRASTLLTKVNVVKAMIFPVVTHGCENWTIRKGRTPKNWGLWTVVLEKNPKSHLDSKIKPIILREINPKYSLEGLMLKLQYFGHLLWTDDSLKKSLMLGKIKNRRRRGRKRMR